MLREESLFIIGSLYASTNLYKVNTLFSFAGTNKLITIKIIRK